MPLFVLQSARLLRTIVLAGAVAFLAISAGAQGRGPGGKEGFGGRGGMVGNDTRLPPRPPAEENTGGLQLGPPGRWWDNKDYARTIGLNSVQQHRMDDVFAANRDNLTRLYKNLQHEESQLKKLTRSQTLDENLIYQQIDRVTAARGELEKGYAKLDDLNAQPQ
jgi:hypothetical protein